MGPLTGWGLSPAAPWKGRWGWGGAVRSLGPSGLGLTATPTASPAGLSRSGGSHRHDFASASRERTICQRFGVSIPVQKGLNKQLWGRVHHHTEKNPRGSPTLTPPGVPSQGDGAGEPFA